MEEIVLNAKEALISNIQMLQKQKEIVEAEIKELEANLVTLNSSIEEQKQLLLATLKAENLKEFKYNGDTAAVFCRENIGYTSDSEVLNWLKAHGYTNFIKTKTTESLDKNPLKKAIKADMILAEALESMTVKTNTEYVVVTDNENYEKMLQHINEGK